MQDYRQNLAYLRTLTQQDLCALQNGTLQIDDDYQSPLEEVPSFSQVHTELDFPSFEGKHRICTYKEPSKTGPAVGNVVLFHGMYSYTGSFCQIAHELASIGFDVFGMDAVGHGRSQGPRGVIHDMGALFRDALSLVERIRKDSGLKVFVGGLSMGGLVAVRLALDSPDCLDGLILLAPALRTSPLLSGMTKLMGRGLGAVLPFLGIGKVSNTDSTKHGIRKYRDGEQLIFKGDKKLGFLRGMINEMDRASAQLSQIKHPFFFVIGIMDKLVDPRMAIDFDQNTASKDKTVLVFRTLWHAVVHQLQIHQIIKEMAQWLLARK